MGVTAYLECYGSEDFDPASGGTGLFGTKGLLPPAWFLFFDAADFTSVRSKHDGSTYSLLRRPASQAAARAHERIEALKPHITPELDAVLRSFLAAVEKACTPCDLGEPLDHQRVLVFNTHRFESTRAELNACIGWFDAFAAKGYSARLATRAESIFDPCDGLDFDEDDRKLDVGDPDALCGWPSSVTDKAPPVVPKPPPPSADASSLDAILARVWAHPADLDVRLACAKELSALGDPRGEFIPLDCAKKLTHRQLKRHEQLLDDARVHHPFSRARTFHQGLPVEVEWNAAPGDPLVGHPAWSTVESVIFSGPVALLPPVRQLQATPALLRAIDRPVPYVSICMSDDKDPAAWAALESTERFPNLVEVRVITPATVWLPEAGQRLITRRPSVRLHASSPLVPLPPLTPLTAEEHAARVARWANPPEARFAEGPRYDNGFN
ncbi:hypothetical protein [Polyangium fumosum]|uniref:Uncharacterized protein n=1 Tax=Polyangium fumosum TaxID=889272 RepID=A0A4U1IP43_9BACT|nr:hypothetical protein [Polyangium fumosum]TKC95844.1 hypothetical protein E8A74_46270 [Polyangium fumosum]